MKISEKIVPVPDYWPEVRPVTSAAWLAGALSVIGG